MERVYSIPEKAKHFYGFSKDEDIKRHPAYKEAKAGNPEAALQLVSDLAIDFVQSLKGDFPKGLHFVSPYAKEATGDNAIPLLLSMLCAQILEGTNETDIVQLQKVFHTGADPMERLLLRPSFEGAVIEGEQYILVDDVTNLGGTLAELANFIILNGGIVAGSIVLVNAGRVKGFTPDRNHIRLLEERFSDEIKRLFSIHTTALTANEASYLIGFRTVDEIRGRCIKAKKETNLRLLSKGIG